MTNVKLTGANTHVATERGYADTIIEPGEMVPADIPVSKEWMKPTGKDAALLAATQAALDPSPDDVDLGKLSKQALEAMATERGIPVAGLSKEDMITAIKAAHDPAR